MHARAVVRAALSALVLLVGPWLTACASDRADRVDSAATNAPVEELGKSDCEAGGHTWTESGCRTQADASSLDTPPSPKETAHRLEYLRLGERGWHALSLQGIEAEGLYYKWFTQKQYKEIESDPRCADNPSCVAFLVRTDSVTSCPDGLKIEGNVYVGDTIVASTQGEVQALPMDSVARVVLPIRSDTGKSEKATFAITKADCQ